MEKISLDMYLMEFANPSFEEGVQMTVRRGRKWFDGLNNGEINQFLGLVGIGETVPRSVATVTTTFLFNKLKDISDFVISQNHDPKCRTREGLEDALLECYGTLEGEFTVVWFYI